MQPNDIIHIYYFPSVSEKTIEIPKQRESIQRISSEDESETAETSPAGPTIIDHSNNRSEDGYIIPLNKIIRFTKDENDEIDALPMRVAPAVSYHRENTNTPTVNARPSKKRTRRGKRAGKKTHTQALRFLEFVSNEAPTVMCSASGISGAVSSSRNEEVASSGMEGSGNHNEMPANNSEPNSNIIEPNPNISEPNSNINEPNSVSHEISASSNETDLSTIQANPAPIVEPTILPVETNAASTEANPTNNDSTAATNATNATNATSLATDPTIQEELPEVLQRDQTESSAGTTAQTTTPAGESTSYVPCIQDVIRYQTAILDPESKCPVVKEVEGRVMK